MNRSDLPALAHRFIRRWFADDVSGIAAGVAFYAVLAMFPTLLAVAAALGFLESLLGSKVGDQVQETVLTSMDRLLTNRASSTKEAVQRLFADESGSLFTFAVAGALWTGSRGTNAVMRAMSRIYGVEEERSFWRRRLVALALLAFTVIAASVALSMFVLGPLLGGGHRVASTVGLGESFALVWRWARFPLAFAALAGWAALMFHVAPDQRKGWRHDLPGAFVTASLWILLSLALRLYLAVAGDTNQVFGVLGGALIVLVWLYLLALALLTGGELNVVLSERHGRPDVVDGSHGAPTPS